MQRFRDSSSPLVVLAALAGILIGGIGGYSIARVSGVGFLPSQSEPQGVDFSPVWKTWHIIDEQFVPAAVASSTPYVATSTADADQKRVYGMISGLVDSLQDPYSFFLPPVENKQFEANMSGVFEGVGMEVDIRNAALTVVSPIKDSPAYKAGIKAGDIIQKIDGENTQGLSVDQAVKKIRGPKGTQVTLTLFRQGWSAPRDVHVMRDVINVPIVTTTEKPGGIFIITVTQFTANSADLFRKALREFIISGKTKLIIDVRGNPGGYLDAAVDMASYFLPAGQVVVTEDYAGHASNIVHRSTGYNVFNDKLKLVILVDKGSASASEILAGALSTQGKAKLVGVNTFGKGSVQELIDITPETSVKLTVARWLLPNGARIPLTGIVPDYIVQDTDEDVKAGKDAQMNKAIELLNAAK